MITEQQYKEALEIVRQYTEQINFQSAKAISFPNKFKRPNEIHAYDWRKYFPTMSTRLINILNDNFEGKRIIDISKHAFLRARGAGLKTWTELCEITCNKY